MEPLLKILLFLQKKIKFLFSFLFILLLVPLLTGCTSKSEKVFNSFMNAVTNFDIDAIKSYGIGTSEDAPIETYLESEDERYTELFQNYYKDKAAKIQYTIDSVKENGNSYLLTVTIKFVNSGPVYTAMIEKSIELGFSGASEDEIYEETKNIFNASNDVFIEKTFNVYINNTNGEWYIEDPNNNLLNVILANSYDTLTSINSLSEEEPSEEVTDIDILHEIDNWLISDIWNTGFCDINWYVTSGTDSLGSEMDVSNTISALENSMSKAIEYNEFILGLDDETYSGIKEAWSPLYEELNSLYEYILANPPVYDENYEFNTDTFSDLMYNFDERITSIEY